MGDVLDAHRAALTFGGRAGILSIDLIEGAIGRPYSGYHKPIAQKAAALLHGLVTSHGFVDGNKRTALLVTLLLIERSGYQLITRKPERVDDIVVGVADGAIDFVALTAWFRERLVR